MTGNVSILSDHLAIGEWVGGVLYAGIVGAFILGAACCALLLHAGMKRNVKGLHAYLVLVEALLVLPLGAADAILDTVARAAILAGGLAFVMGLQNAIVTHISDARVRTTHVSGMATDLGMELAVLLAARKSDAGTDAGNLRKLRLHGSTMVAFLVGGIIGVVIYRQVQAYLFILVSAILVGIAFGGLYSVWRPRR